MNTSVPAWIFLNIVPGIGTGILFSAMNYSLQAAVKSEDIAFAVAFFTFFRSFGQTVGVAVGGAVFQNQLRQKLLTYPLLAAQADVFSQDASGLVQVIKSMPNDLPQKAQLIQAYADSLKVVWIVMCALSAAALLSSIFIKGYSLDREHNTEQGFQDKEKTLTVEDGTKKSDA